MAQIAKKNDKVFGDVENSAKIKKVHIDSPQLSYLFGGGIPIGRMLRFRGPESSGKSITCNYIAAQLQKKLPETLGQPDKDVIIYIDFERTFEARFASQVGVDTSPEKFIHLLPDDIETASDVITELIKTDEIAAIILDSDAAAPTKAMFTDPSGKANFGAGAKALAEFLRKINILCANYNTTLLWISQERVNMSPMGYLPGVTGGEAPKFYASVVNRVTKTDVLKSGNDTIGIAIRVRNYKNKAGVPFRDANIKLYYDGGFNPDEEYLDFLIAFDIIKQGGAYFTIPGVEKKIQGRAKVQEWLNENVEEYEKMKAQVDEMLVNENALDADREMMGEDEVILEAKERIEDEISEDVLEDE